jgi:hypothetical protein
MWEEDYKGNNTSPSLQSPLANSSTPSSTVHATCTKQMHTKFYAVSLKGKVHLQDQGVDGTAVSMQLKFILRCEGLAGSGQSPVDRILFPDQLSYHYHYYL